MRVAPTWSSFAESIIASIFQVDLYRKTPHPNPVPLGEG
ncbi:hypothetical protein EMIT0P265_80155 [Pseudomonas zeae]